MHVSADKVIKTLQALARGAEFDANENEKRLAKPMHKIMLDSQLNKNFEIDDYECLDFLQSEEEDYVFANEDDFTVDNQQFTLEYMENVIRFIESFKTKPKFTNVQTRFKRITDRNYISRFYSYVSAGGTYRMKLDQICKHTFDKFRLARQSGFRIHDRDLKSWAITKAREIGLVNFKASDGWIFKLKSLNKITSRRITKFVTNTAIKNADEIANSATASILEMEEFIEKNHISHGQVFNIDQSGINYELSSARTLSFRGEKIL